MTFYYQNQRWYCHSCQDYTQPFQPQVQQYQQPVYTPQYAQQYAYQPAYQPAPYQQAMPVVDETIARSKIYGGMKMRENTDKMISTRWAFGMLAFQLIVPILSIALLYFTFIGTTFNLSNAGQIAVIICIFLAVVAMVIFQSILVYKLVARRDEHFRRDGLMNQGMVEYLDAVSVKEKKDINVERWTMNSIIYSANENSRGPGLWALLVSLIAIIPIIGVFAMLYCLHFLTKDVHDHDKRQRDFNYQFQLAMYKMGKIDTISYDWVPMHKRDSAAYVMISIFTVGYFLPYWWYVNINDMNSHMTNQWKFETWLIEITKETATPVDKPEVQQPTDRKPVAKHVPVNKSETKPNQEVEQPNEILPEP